jgi:hypothetical protein
MQITALLMSMIGWEMDFLSVHNSMVISSNLSFFFFSLLKRYLGKDNRYFAITARNEPTYIKAYPC